jgi:hypothetical protein
MYEGLLTIHDHILDETVDDVENLRLGRPSFILSQSI